jgi:prevent-host-death family protein
MLMSRHSLIIQIERDLTMQRILPSEDIRPISRLGSEAVKLLKDVRRNGRPVFLTSNGQAAGVLMDIEEYERLLELIEFHETIRASEAEADRGEVISHEELEKESKHWIKKAKKR